MKERATAAKHKLAHSAWRSGAILTTAAGTGASSPQNRSLSLNGSVLSTASSSSSPSSSRRGSASGTPTGTSSRLSLGSQTRVKVQGQGQGLSLGSRQQSGKEEETSAWDVIEALDSQRSALEARNEELMDMLKELNLNLNLNNTSGDNKGDRDSFLLFDDSNADGNRMAEESVIDSSLASKGSPSSAGRPDSRITPLLTPTAAKMYDMITEQQKTIELADSKCDMWRVKVEDSETLNSHLRGRVQEMKEVRSNHTLTQQYETALFLFFPPSIF